MKFRIDYGSQQIGGFDLNPLAADQKTVAERQWSAPTKARVPQKACDVGLFSDDRDQLDMVEMFQQPAED